MDFRESLINKNDGERDWLDVFCNQVTRGKQADIKKEASTNILKYADFQCTGCGAPFTKDYVINHLSGVCDKCHGSDIIKIHSETENENNEKLYQCTNCDNEYPKSELNKKCACGSTRFVSKSLLQQVTANTADYLLSQDLNVEDVWFEKGKVFASIQGTTESNTPWKTVIVASGTFTKNDVLMYSFEENEAGGYATVATAQDDPLIKFATNNKCQVYWETEQFDPNKNLRTANIVDSNGFELNIGDTIEWITPKSPVRGEILTASKNGEIEIGIIYDELGPANHDQYASIVQLNQNAINNLRAEAIKTN